MAEKEQVQPTNVETSHATTTASSSQSNSRTISTSNTDGRRSSSSSSADPDKEPCVALEVQAQSVLLKPVVGNSRYKWRHRVTMIAAKSIAATAGLMLLPFAPFFAEALGVTLSHWLELVAIVEICNLTVPILGPFGDRYGPKAGVVAASTMTVVGTLIPSATLNYSAAGFALVLCGLGFKFFGPASISTIASLTTPDKFGREVGILETSFAIAPLVGYPIVGELLERFGWRGPFVFLCISAFLLLLLQIFAFPAIRRPEKDDNSSVDLHTDKALWRVALSGWKKIICSKHAMASLLFGLIFFNSMASVLANYGVWLKEQYDLGSGAVGLTSIVIGFGELLGELLVVFFSDRIGLLKSTGIGAVCMIVSALALAFLGNVALWLGLFCIFWFFVALEFCIVSFLPYVGLIMPEIKTTMNSAFTGSMGLGFFVALQYVETLWSRGGLVWMGLNAAFQVCVATLVWYYLWRTRVHISTSDVDSSSSGSESVSAYDESESQNTSNNSQHSNGKLDDTPSKSIHVAKTLLRSSSQDSLPSYSTR